MRQTSQNPSELVDRYLQGVRFWLPQSAKPEDLLAELGEDLRSQIDAKEEELGHPLDRAEVAAILKACGNPMRVASRIGPQQYVIGPTLFPIYRFVLKKVLLGILLPVFIFILGPINFANSDGNMGQTIVATLGGLWYAGFLAAGSITLVFAILERTGAAAKLDCKWDPSKLPPVERPPRKTSFAQTVSELFFNIFGLVWLLLIPQHPFMILGPAAAFLKPAPLWNTFYIPIVLISAFAIARLVVILGHPRWTLWPLISQIAQAIYVLMLIKFLLGAAAQVPGSNWYPFLMLADSVKNSSHYIAIAAVVNVSIWITLMAMWFGIAIGVVVHMWKLLRQIREQGSGTHQTAPLQAR